MANFEHIALQAAYNEGEEWLDELNQYLYENYQAVKEFFNSELPQVRVTRLEGTYLVWLDILPFELSSDEAYEKLMNDGKDRTGIIHDKYIFLFQNLFYR